MQYRYTRETERNRRHIKAVLLWGMQHRTMIQDPLRVAGVDGISVVHLGLVLHPGGERMPYLNDSDGVRYSLGSNYRLVITRE